MNVVTEPEQALASDRKVALISAVIPVYNERESVVQLHREISEMAATVGQPFEFVFVDDGSNDGSWETLTSIAAGDDRVSLIRFRRNFGKAAALAAGFAASRGDFVFTLDADLQDDPQEIPRFLAKLDEGYDVVSGWKKRRHDPWHKTLPSRVFNQMVSWLTGVKLHDHNCGFKCYRGEVLNEIELYGEFHRFTPVLAAARGFRIGEIVVNHRARKFGKSKYGFGRFIRGFIDLLTVAFLTSYRNRPQHLLGSLGLIVFGLGLAGMLWLVGVWVANEWGGANYGPIGSRPLLIYSAVGLLMGAQMLSIGLIAELITARSHEARHVYSVAEQRLARHRRETTE